jgi:hypothetical protein
MSAVGIVEIQQGLNGDLKMAHCCFALSSSVDQFLCSAIEHYLKQKASKKWHPEWKINPWGF